MTTTIIEWDKNSLAKVDKILADKVQKAWNMSKPMKECSVLMWKDVLKHFKDEAGPSGKWQKLKDTTARAFVTEKKQRGYSHILVNTGRLKGSIEHDASNFTAKVTSEVGGKNYGIFHEKGTQFIPQRRFMWLSEEVKKNMMEVIKNYFITEK